MKRYYYILEEHSRRYYVEADSFAEACHICGLTPRLTKVIYRTED